MKSPYGSPYTLLSQKGGRYGFFSIAGTTGFFMRSRACDGRDTSGETSKRGRGDVAPMVVEG